MRMRSFLTITLLFVSLVAAAAQGKGKASAKPARLIKNFYKVTRTCPGAEQLVKQITEERVGKDPTLIAKLLRVHYHDCFVRGCDASILLDTVAGGNQSEKDARPNLSLGGFDVIDEIKTRVEKLCEGKVSCADILALTARDAVSFPFKKPLWDVPTGRKDGRVSLLSDVNGNLPSPFSDFATLQTIFTKKNLNTDDLVALSGAHTIGVSHCGAFSRRLFNFTGKGDADPSLDPSYVEFLKKQCPNPANPATVVGMDPNSTLSFDTHYFAAVNNKQGLFQSDAALLTDGKAAATVRQFQLSQKDFFRQFGKSMVKMGEIEVLLGDAGEIRKNCRFIN